MAISQQKMTAKNKQRTLPESMTEG